MRKTRLAFGLLMSSRLTAATKRSENIRSAAFWKCAIMNIRKCWWRKRPRIPPCAFMKNLSLASPRTMSVCPDAMKRARVGL